MSPSRIGRNGSFRFEIDWTAKLGFRIDRSAETTVKREYDALVALLYELRANGQIEVLRRFARGEIAIATLKQAKRLGRVKSDTLLADLSLLERLWHRDAQCPLRADPPAPHSDECLGATDRILPRMAKGETNRRYATSLAKLRRVAKTELPDSAAVQDLARVDWQSLFERWPGGGSDWNHMRRAVSKLLSTILGHPHHPTRLEIIGKIPLAGEEERVPELTVDEFWSIVEATPEHARPCYVILAATGMRLGEYLRCTEEHLVPAKYSIRVPGTKTKRSRRVIELGPEAWPWIEAGIPSPLKSRWIHIHWWRACVKLGFGRNEQLVVKGVPQFKTVRRAGKADERVPILRYAGLRIHDLRHVTGQVATDEGATTAQVGDALGHSDYKTTARYQRRRHSRVVGQKVSSALFQPRART
jgi:integrase